MKRLLLVVAAALLWVAPAQAFSKQTGFQTMSDGVKIAYDLYEPDGTAPAGGWPGVVVMHGLGGSKDDMATVAQTFVSHGYAALAYTDRGHGTSGGDAGLAGPDDIATERAMVASKARYAMLLEPVMRASIWCGRPDPPPLST